ncbi:MAG: dihydroorotate dehydrogenase electron transfer subunit [bacterium JZ-2024 1]
MKAFVCAPISENRKLPGERYYLTALCAPEIARTALPGQFVMVQTFERDQYTPLLPRPFSICDVEGDDIVLFYKIWGPGSYWLSIQPPGRPVGVYGPLGRGFDLTPGVPRVLAGGGTGIAPMVFFSSYLHRQGNVSRVSVIVGGRSSADLAFVDHFRQVTSDVYLATEDGSAGEPGFPTPILERLLTEANPLPRVAICGPMAMVVALWELAREFGAEIEAALEAPMACGVGACLGCVDSYFGIKTCCEGPVWRNFFSNFSQNEGALARERG